MTIPTASIIVDNFAGGGGASTGIERAIGRPIDYAINHDPRAIAMHRANHPHTYHYCEDVWAVDPMEVSKGRQVSIAWFSPDCVHFSRARGGKPVKKNIRGLAWVATRYAKVVHPDLIFLENVQEFEEWGPLKQNEATGEWYADKDRAGETFRKWVNKFRKMGYSVDWKSLVACDFGAPTSRTRLFLVARLDGKPIVWPEPTHGIGKIPYRTAAECVDWSIPCPSIFSRKKPLAENTLRRIARGLQRFVIDAADPFIIVSAHAGQGDARRCYPLERPLTTITARGTQNQLLTAFLTRYFGQGTGRSVKEPAPTTTPGGLGKTGLVTSHLIKLWGACRHGQDLRQPMPTVTAGGNHLGEVRAFLVKYYGRGTGQALNEPAHTLTSKAKLGLVTVAGENYQIVDIGMRMWQPRELYRAQGFPNDYIIDPIYNGKPLTKTAQVWLVGNSVSPHPAEALVRANL